MNGTHLRKQQSGAAILIFFLVLFTTSAAVLLRAVNNASFGTQLSANTVTEMVAAKQMLLAFAMSYAENFPGSPPGRFPCPDSDNDVNGLPNSPCNANNNPGRLPIRLDTGNGEPFMFSEYGLLNGQRFWYAVSPTYRQSATAALNSSTTGTLTLDGQNDIVAMIVAPGDVLTGQTRPNNTASNYLESTNVAGVSFVSGFPANPSMFNDRVLPIYRHEVMTLVTARVVQVIRERLDTHHPANGNSYPVDEPAFQAVITAPPLSWLTSNNWDSVANYVFLNSNNVTLSFDGCDIEYTITFGSNDISRSQPSCEVSP